MTTPVTTLDVVIAYAVTAGLPLLVLAGIIVAGLYEEGEHDGSEVDTGTRDIGSG